MVGREVRPFGRVFLKTARGDAVELPQWLAWLFGFLLQILPVLLWMAFWLLAVDWRKVWAVLAQGAWAPCVLLGLIVATAWSRMDPVECRCLPFATIPPFWWQLGAVAALASLALFSGWLQGQWNYSPP